MAEISPSLRTLFQQGQELNTDAPEEIVSDLIRQVRSQVQHGVKANREALQQYMHLANRFDYLPDTWNASQLLAETGELDLSARLIRTSAWMRLFPDSVRKRPQLVLALLRGEDEDEPRSSRFGSLLSNWLNSCLLAYESHGNLPELIESLTAATELARCWGPEETWEIEAPGFSVIYAEITTVIAHSLAGNSEHASKQLAIHLARGLRWQRLAVEGGEAAGADEELVPADEQPAWQAPGQERLNHLVSEINQRRLRIWVVGAIVPRWHKLMGVAKAFGLHEAVFHRLDFQEVKQQALLGKINMVRDFGILLGPVPHSVRAGGRHSSLSVQLKREAGVAVVELRTHSSQQELRITKTSFRIGLQRLLDEGFLQLTP